MPKVNRPWVLQNLRETIEHIESAIALIEKGNDDGLEVWIEAIYRDLNRAWNGRYLTMTQCNERDEQIRSFPPDIQFSD